MLALHGFDAVGLEVSSTAVDVANAYCEFELRQPGGANFGANENRADYTVGTVSIVRGDFFESGWESALFGGSHDGFDLIYDYTVSVSRPG